MSGMGSSDSILSTSRCRRCIDDFSRFIRPLHVGVILVNITIRPAREADAEACGRIGYEGFRLVDEGHGFPPTFPSLEAAARRAGALIRHPSVFTVVAASADGAIVGFCCLDE